MARKISILNKRKLIIDAASKLFCHYGYEKTTLDDIAKEAGLGKGTIYSEFSSKEAIMNAVITLFMKDVNKRLREFIATKKGPVCEIIREVLIRRIMLYYDHVKNNFHGAELFTISCSNLGQRDEIHLETDKIIAELLKKAAEQGEILAFDDYLKTASYIRKALISLHPPMVLSLESKEEVLKEANELLDILLSGLTIKINFNIRKKGKDNDSN